jgi:hypothetical protein
MDKRVISNFIVTPELKELLISASAERGLSISSFVRMVLLEWLKNNGYANTKQ